MKRVYHEKQTGDGYKLARLVYQPWKNYGEYYIFRKIQHYSSSSRDSSYIHHGCQCFVKYKSSRHFFAHVEKSGGI